MSLVVYLSLLKNMESKNFALLVPCTFNTCTPVKSYGSYTNEAAAALEVFYKTVCEEIDRMMKAGL